jgi:hypothetical protein
MLAIEQRRINLTVGGGTRQDEKRLGKGSTHRQTLAA